MMYCEEGDVWESHKKKDVVNKRESLDSAIVTMTFYVVTPADSVHM